MEVLEHFGAEAPALLNNYACAVEDALIEQVQRGQNMNLMLDAAGEERAAMNIMLTDPDILADYVNDFFSEGGPYPVETAEEQAEREAYEYRAQLEYEMDQYENDYAVLRTLVKWICRSRNGHAVPLLGRLWLVMDKTLKS